MTLRDIIEKLTEWVNIRVVISEYGNVIATYEDAEDADYINNYLDCEVEIIDTTEDGTLVIVVDDSTGEE